MYHYIKRYYIVYYDISSLVKTKKKTKQAKQNKKSLGYDALVNELIAS